MIALARRFLRRHPSAWLALLGGACLGGATPPFDLYPLVFVGLVALALASREAEDSRAGLGASRLCASWFGAWWLFAATANVIGLRFVPSVLVKFTPLGTAPAIGMHLLLGAAQALAWGCGGALAVLLMRRLRAPLELAMCAGVLLATSLPGVFPWTVAAILSPWPLVVQGADVVGERGLTALFAAGAAALLRAPELRNAAATPASKRSAAAALAVTGGTLAAMLGYGAWSLARWSEPGAPSDQTRLALVHAGIEATMRWDPRRAPQIVSLLRRETAEAELAGIDLSVWPEAAYPYPLRHGERFTPGGQREIVGGAVDGPVLFGFIAHEPQRRGEDGGVLQDSYNSASVTFADRSMTASYDKLELLWFGETVPLGSAVPWLRRTFQRGGGLLPGAEPRALEVPRAAKTTLRLGVLNCYEDTLPDLGRRIVRALGPNLLVNVTNDAWFEGTVEPELHFRLAVMRAIELRRDLVRAVNLGVSGHVDAAGVVRARRDDAKPGFLVVTPSLRDDEPTIYARFGDAPSWALVFLASAASWLRTRRRRAGDGR